MATRKRIIEGTWTCSSCGNAGIRGREKVCPSCGNPREAGAESSFDFSARRAVSDGDTVSVAKAGRDWHCARCGAANRGDAHNCVQCGAERVPTPIGARRLPWFRYLPFAIVGIVFLGIAVCIALSYMRFDRTGTVRQAAWHRMAWHQTFDTTVAEGWRDQIPTGPTRLPTAGVGEYAGNDGLHGCASRQRSTRQVPDGTERVCRTEYDQVACGTEEHCTTHDLGNGFAEESCSDVTKYCSESKEVCEDKVKYRDEPVYDDWCTWDSRAWRIVETREVSGVDSVPALPDTTGVVLGPLDRVLPGEEFTVTIADGDESHEIHPESEAEFLRWKAGAKVTLTVDGYGEFQEARLPD